MGGPSDAYYMTGTNELSGFRPRAMIDRIWANTGPGPSARVITMDHDAIICSMID